MARSQRLFLLTSALLVCMGSLPAQARTWVTKTPMPTTRRGLGVGIVNDILYAVGGESPSGPPLKTVEAYDPATDTWSEKAPMLTARKAHGVGVVNGILYAVGGLGQQNSRLRSVEAYDPAKDCWTVRASMATPRFELGVGVAGGILYAIGGCCNGETGLGNARVARVEAYDPATNKWTSKAPMPEARVGFAIGALNGILYVAGGATSSIHLKKVVAYDPAGNTWATRTSMPTIRHNLRGGVLDGMLYAVGGELSTGTISIGTVSTVEAYDPVTNSWSVQLPMLTVRNNMGIGVVGDALYVVGGHDGSTFLQSLQAFAVEGPLNLPPTANAAVTQLTAIGTSAAIGLDGTGSSDPDDAFGDLTFKWTVDSVVVCEGTAAQCASTVVQLPIDIALGSHQVTLRVTDPEGASDETSTTVTVHPAQLSVLKIGEAEVEFDGNERQVEVSGEIGLPFGTSFSNLLAKVRTSLAVGGKSLVLAEDLAFAVKGAKKKEWKFANESAATGITKFQIDWKGARYRFHAKDFPVKLESKLITTDETILEIKLVPKKITGAFTLSIGTLGTVSFDADGTVTSSTVPYEARRKKVTLTLAGPLEATTAIVFSGGLSRVVQVGADLKASVGRFHLHAKFGGTFLPAGVDTTPRSLDFSVKVGTQGYSGSTSLGPTELVVDGNEWEFEEDDD